MKNHSIEDTAKKFGVRHNTICRWAKKLGIDDVISYQLNNVLNKEIVKYHEKCNHIKECLDNLCIKSSTNSKKVDIEELKIYFRTHTIHECAEKFECGYNTIRKKLKEAGIRTSKRKRRKE